MQEQNSPAAPLAEQELPPENEEFLPSGKPENHQVVESTTAKKNLPHSLPSAVSQIREEEQQDSSASTYV
jgi:hypothetical protein